MALDQFFEIIEENRRGEGGGVCSVCSANPVVIRAGMLQALEDGCFILVESTSNQVDQTGGYTGMTPDQFVSYVYGLAEEVWFPEENVLLGGDHLGPNRWQSHSEKEAMEQASILIRDYVKAGYKKIHLDTSMFLADDTGDRSKPLDDEIVASRTVELCRVAEKTWQETTGADSDADKPFYIIGTEVPIPGGAQEHEDAVKPTTPEDARTSLEVTKKAFLDAGLEDAWKRVVALVVQPGVEFGDDQIFEYDRSRIGNLSKTIEAYPGMVYEAHSTDYQREELLQAMADDHFCIQKVGPWLTYAYREALFALEHIERELLDGGSPGGLSSLSHTLEQVMVEHPEHWVKYYTGSEEEKAFKRKYSYSDRSRYYWPFREVEQAVEKLYSNLEHTDIPLTLISQYMPNQYWAVREGTIIPAPSDLVIHKIREVYRIYARACRLCG